MHIKHLESYFNVTLIRRSIKHKKIFITEEGKLLYQRAKQLINFMNEVKVDLLNKKHVISGNIRIGADRKSTRLNSSHANISYAVFCLKKKNPQPATGT